MSDLPFEIERKYLIEYPDLDMLRAKKGVRIVEISQTFLTKNKEGGARRVRIWKEGEETTYFFTEKRHITNMKRVEIEYPISQDEYNEFLKERDPERMTIDKVRYRYNENGFEYEVDIFPFWDTKAYLEVEVDSEDRKILFPEDLKLIRDVTEEPEYTNYAMAKQIPL